MAEPPAVPPDLPPFTPGPIVLEGPRVRLEPLTEAHAEGLMAIGEPDSTWRFTSRPPFRDVQTARWWIEDAHPHAVPFAVVHKASGRVAGSTRYFDIRPADRGLEIGYTWYGEEFQRTPVNTECKFLLLHHAFEGLGTLRVQLRTDLRNTRSQNAIERIGGVREGVLRSHIVMPDGYLRDTVVFSIIRPEWPAVERRLLDMLSR